jgi:hypothetical protein
MGILLEREERMAATLEYNGLCSQRTSIRSFRIRSCVCLVVKAVEDITNVHEKLVRFVTNTGEPP